MPRFFPKILLLVLLMIPNAHAGFFSDIADSMSSSDESMTEDEKAHPEAYRFNNSGIKKQRAQDYQGAIADYTQAIELWPEYALAYVNRASAKSWLDDRVGQVADDEKAVALDPNNLGYKNNLSVARNELRRATMLSLEEKSHPQAYALFQSGMTKFNVKDYQGAIIDYAGAIKFDPKFAEAYKIRGASKSLLGDNNGRLDDLNKAIALEPNIADFYTERAAAKSYLDDWAGQVTDDEKAVALEPYNQTYITARDSAKANLSKLVFAAIQANDVAKATKLLNSNVQTNLDLYYSDGDSILGWAAFQGKLDVVKLLASHGADVNLPSGALAMPPLHKAVMGGYLEVAAYLIDHGANMNTINPEWGTPLHIATFHQGDNYRAIEKLLIAKGANTSLKNKHGYTAFEWDKWRREDALEANRRNQQRTDDEFRAKQYAQRQAEIEKQQAEQNARDMADLHGNQGGGYWQMNVEANQKALKDMQTADAARRNADYRRQNNCSAGDTRAECR
jgi:tetratricopeptide (TPR) repeat protein